MQKTFTLFFELLVVFVALFIADYLQQQFSFIPRTIIHLPEVDYSEKDFNTILTYFLIIHALAFILAQRLAGPWQMSSAPRTANELFTLAAAFSTSSLVVFITTSVNFDPNFIVAIAATNATLFIVIFLVARLFGELSIFKAAPQLGLAVFKRLFSVSGVLIVLLALTPGILAKVFVSSRDVANVITQARLFFSNNSEMNYSLVSATGDYRFLLPMEVKTAPGNNNIRYILERSGRLYSLRKDFSQPPELLLNIADKVGYIEMENGALGFAFHPQFGQESINQHRIYLYYTDVRDNSQTNRLSSFDLGGKSPSARSDSEIPLFRLNRETSGFHNGGSVVFGADGFLYIALGEGIRTPEYRSQADTLRMGVLRIDVDKQGGKISKPISKQPKNGQTSNYYIPMDNPFVDREGILEEYWATGLRNPFRMSFDPETGQLWAGDVGSTKWEEVNLIKKGGHYQFPFIEGFEEKKHKRPTPFFGTETPPVYTYFHTASERAVIGGIVYRGNKHPKLKGTYLFADNYASIIYMMEASGKKVDAVEKIARADQFAQRGISSVSQLPDGEIIVTTLGRSGTATGEILKLVYGKSEQTKANQPVKEEHITQQEITAIFSANCSRCHGSKGQADGPDTALLGVAIADFTAAEFQNSRTDEFLGKVIAKGGMANELSPSMPPWKSILTAQEIEGLVQHIRELQNDENRLN